jgi:hypothetical protein
MNPAGVRCSACSRPLCQACDHRIRGFPFCQDCIVAGVELLQRQSRSSDSPIIRRQTSPLAATLLSLVVPGLGAAYNGQTSKAIVHFAVFASFFQMATATGGTPFFVWCTLCTLLFATVDAYRTAQLIRAGLAPDAEGDAITRRLYGNPLAWGLVLIVLGTVFLLNTLFNIMLPLREMLPIALVLLGAYILIDYLRRRQKRETPGFDLHRPPPSVISALPKGEKFYSTELTTQVSARREP